MGPRTPAGHQNTWTIASVGCSSRCPDHAGFAPSTSPQSEKLCASHCFRARTGRRLLPAAVRSTAVVRHSSAAPSTAEGCQQSRFPVQVRHLLVTCTCAKSLTQGVSRLLYAPWREGLATPPAARAAVPRVKAESQPATYLAARCHHRYALRLRHACVVIAAAAGWQSTVGQSAQQQLPPLQRAAPAHLQPAPGRCQMPS